MSEILYKKYRPQSFEEVLGQDETVLSLSNLIANGSCPRGIIFTGMRGTGKTTLARIIAKEVGCYCPVEIDAGSEGAVALLREQVEEMEYTFGDGAKVKIIDEAHVIKKDSFNVFLKPVEDAPDHAYWIFCTTEDHKIPETLKSRCARYHLDPIHSSVMKPHLENICSKESIDLPAKALDLIIEKSEGSLREALVLLAVVRSAESLDEVQKLLRTAVNKEDGILYKILYKAINGGKNWSSYKMLAAKVDSSEVGSIRPILTKALNNKIKNCRDDEFKHLTNLLDAVSEIPMSIAEMDAETVLHILIRKFIEYN